MPTDFTAPPGRQATMDLKCDPARPDSQPLAAESRYTDTAASPGAK